MTSNLLFPSVGCGAAHRALDVGTLSLGSKYGSGHFQVSLGGLAVFQ